MVLYMPSEGRKETQDMTQAEFIDYLQENWKHKTYNELVKITGRSYYSIRAAAEFLRLRKKITHRVDGCIGERFGRLVILEREGSWAIVKCDCGNVVKVKYSNLRSGRTRSCGCLRKEVATEELKRKKNEALQNRKNSIG